MTFDTSQFVATKNPQVGDVLAFREPVYAMRAGVQAVVSIRSVVAKVRGINRTKTGDAMLTLYVLESSDEHTLPSWSEVRRKRSKLIERAPKRALWDNEAAREPEPEPGGKAKAAEEPRLL
jgi:hypothetical protein